MKDQPWAGVAVFLIFCIFVVAIIFAVGHAHAAETLPAVLPPTDWTGVLIVVGLGLVIFLPVAYAIYVKLKAGTQPGEETINKLLDALNKSHETIQTQTAVIAAKPAMIVGERGPEIINMPRAAEVMPPPVPKFPANW